MEPQYWKSKSIDANGRQLKVYEHFDTSKNVTIIFESGLFENDFGVPFEDNRTIAPKGKAKII